MTSLPSSGAAAVIAAHDHPNASRAVAGTLRLTAGLVFLVVVWGALVRLTGSGLSIPDWPLINGSLLPPFTDAGWQAVLDDYRTEAIRLGKPGFPSDIALATFKNAFWIEYLHRALAALVGIALVVGLVKGFRSAEVRAKADVNLYLLTVLLAAQAGLGGVVVKGGLHALLVAAHLVAAYLFFALVIWTALKLTRDDRIVAGGSRSAGYTPLRLAWLTAGLFLLQVAFGGLVAGGGAANIMNTFPMMLGSLLPPAEMIWSNSYARAENILLNTVFVQFMHRWLPLLVLGSYVALRVATLRSPLTSRTFVVFRATESLLALQIVVGIFNLLYRAPAPLSALHSAIALATFGGLIILLYDLRHASGEAVSAVKECY